MFGRSRSVAFDPYGRRRARGRPPRWLVLLVIGAAIGAGGVVFVQERYLPARLSPQASAELRSAFANADAERFRLAGQLGETSRQLATALADRKTLTEAVAASRPTIESLRDELGVVIATLPADPRGGAVEIRAGRLVTKGGVLSYDLVLTQERSAAKPLAATLRFTISGDSARAAPGTFAAPPVATMLESRQVLRGSVALPAAFRARQATIEIVDSAGKTLGMRVLLIK